MPSDFGGQASVGETSVSIDTAVSVRYAVSGSAVDAADFVGSSLPSGTVSFAAGETSKTISVPVSGDNDAESDERFRVTLQSPSNNATIGSGFVEGLIEDDDRREVNSRIFSPSLIAGPQIVAGDNTPTAIIFRATMQTVVTVVPIGFASASETIRILDGDTNQISEFVAGVATATVSPGSLYAITFGPQSAQRFYSVRSSAGYGALSSVVGTNVLRPTDTNADGETTALDALMVINSLAQARGAEGELVNDVTTNGMLDVNGDGNVTALDALMVINQMAQEASRGVGESESSLYGEQHSDDATQLSSVAYAVSTLGEAEEWTASRLVDGSLNGTLDSHSPSPSTTDEAFEAFTDWRDGERDQQIELLVADLVLQFGSND